MDVRSGQIAGVSDMNRGSEPIPLRVDLDGTLIRTDGELFYPYPRKEHSP
jgi:hypothetical protein